MCLSLLGTWPGEKWRPGESTILQVLISIQAMIFVADPLDNVPADHSKAGVENLFSVKFISGLTTKYAILNWAHDPPGFWKDVVNLHVHEHADTILRTAERWAVSASRTYTPYPNQRLLFVSPLVRQYQADFATILPQLQVTLQGYGATYVSQKIAPSHSQQNVASDRTGHGSQMPPYARGGRSNGPGSMGGYGGPGFQFGRGF